MPAPCSSRIVVLMRIPRLADTVGLPGDRSMAGLGEDRWAALAGMIFQTRRRGKFRASPEAPVVGAAAAAAPGGCYGIDREPLGLERGRAAVTVIRPSQ